MKHFKIDGLLSSKDNLDLEPILKVLNEKNLYFLGKIEEADSKKNYLIKTENDATIADYVSAITKKVIKKGKNDGNHQFSKACGVFEMNDIKYEIKIVMEPRQEKWLGENDTPEFLKVL